MPKVDRSVPQQRVFLFGNDIGQEADNGAVFVAERIGDPPSMYHCGYLRMVPLGTAYHEHVSEVVEKVYHPKMRNHRRVVIVDATSVGRPVMEMFARSLRERRELAPKDDGLVQLVGVTITAGDTPTIDRGESWWKLNVPKKALVTALEVVLQGKRLSIDPTMPDVANWRAQMHAFTRKTRPSGSITYEAQREGDHDDLVVASMLAVWYGEHRLPKLPPHAGGGKLKAKVLKV